MATTPHETDSNEADPNKAAYLAALEKKKSQGGKGTSTGNSAENSKAKSSGPTARRIERRRSGSS